MVWFFLRASSASNWRPCLSTPMARGARPVKPKAAVSLFSLVGSLLGLWGLSASVRLEWVCILARIALVLRVPIESPRKSPGLTGCVVPYVGRLWYLRPLVCWFGFLVLSGLVWLVSHQPPFSLLWISSALFRASCHLDNGRRSSGRSASTAVPHVLEPLSSPVLCAWIFLHRASPDRAPI